jgi:UDP-glucose:(heptosyl)LPS alpha-1,3-glucosyltransferase
MKVAIISFRTFKHGGVERYAFELVNSLADRAEVHLFTHECADGLRAEVHKIPAVGKKDLFSVNSFMVFLKKRIKQESFDIVHTMGPLYLTPDVVTAHICQKRLLRDTKSLFGDFSLIKKSYWAFRSRIASSFQKKSFTNAKCVIAVSSILANELQEEYDIHDVRVLYPGISREFFDVYDPVKKKTSRDAIGVDRNKFVILFVGGQWERKGLGFLIEAMKHLQEGTLLMIVGNGDEEKFRALARAHGVEAKIVFQGFRKDIVSCYLAADVLVLPSLYEPFGYPVLEAMAMGLPVIASRDVGAAEIITEAETGFVIEDAQDTIALASRIDHVIEKGSYAFYEAARSEAEKYLWRYKIEEIINIYKGVLEERNAKASSR